MGIKQGSSWDYHSLNLEERHCKAGTQTSCVDVSEIQSKSQVLLDFDVWRGPTWLVLLPPVMGLMRLDLAVVETRTKGPARIKASC